MTKAKPNARGAGKVIGSFDEVIIAVQSGEVELLTRSSAASAVASWI